MTRLTKNFTLEEMIQSATATKLGINNRPDPRAEHNMLMLCRNILQPLRDAWGQPIIVSSGYRNYTLNKHVGGAANSDHLYGCAADITTRPNSPADNRRLFDLALSLMHSGQLQGVKQIIDEHHYTWLHLSWQDGRTAKRNQVLHL